MKRIFEWIKTNLLGIEPKRRRHKKTKSAKSARGSAAKKSAKPAVRAQIKKAVKTIRSKANQLPAKVSRSEGRTNRHPSARPERSRSGKLKPKAAAKPVKIAKPLPEKKTGVITHFFPNVSAAIVKVTGPGIEIGDELHFKGVSTDFKIIVKSMQLNRRPILVAEKGQEIGIQVPEKVRQDDEVFKIIKKG